MCAVTLDDANEMFVHKDIKTYVVTPTKEYLSTTTLLVLRFESSRRSNFFSHVFKRNLVLLTIHTTLCEVKECMIKSEEEECTLTSHLLGTGGITCHYY